MTTLYAYKGPRIKIHCLSNQILLHVPDQCIINVIYFLLYRWRRWHWQSQIYTNINKNTITNARDAVNIVCLGFWLTYRQICTSTYLVRYKNSLSFLIVSFHNLGNFHKMVNTTLQSIVNVYSWYFLMSRERRLYGFLSLVSLTCC